MKVLLINIKSKTTNAYVPLGLLKLSTFYKKKGDSVEYIFAGQTPKQVPNIICFSTIFLFNIKKEIGFIKAYQKKYPQAIIRIGGISASLRPDLFKQYLGNKIDLHVGLCDEIDQEKPDYDIAGVNFSYGFTSRGCINKCAWCVVPKLEGSMVEIPYWENCLSSKHKLFLGMDNNILACSPDRLDKILFEIHKRNMTIDFNQGMDCVLFAKNEDFAKVIAKYPRIFKSIRFAWDSVRQNKYVDITCDLLKKYNIKPKIDFTWYCLYGFKEKPQIVYERFKAILNHKHRIKAMRYRDIETGKYGDYWGGFDADIANYLFGKMAITGVLPPAYLKFLGEDFEHFKKIIKAIRLINKTTKRNILAGDFNAVFKLANRL